MYKKYDWKTWSQSDRQFFNTKYSNLNLNLNLNLDPFQSVYIDELIFIFQNFQILYPDITLVINQSQVFFPTIHNQPWL